MQWIATVLVVGGGESDYMFKRFSSTNQADFTSVIWQHFIEIARLLTERTDDPKTGVGDVIVNMQSLEILSFGWNGFPSKHT